MAQQTLKELLYNGSKVVVEVARRDGLGKQIDTTYLQIASFNWSGLSNKPFASLDSDDFTVDNTVLKINYTTLNGKYVELATYNTLVNTTLPATYVAISGFKSNYLDANNVIYENDNITRLTNNAGYITSTYCYSKSETYTKTEVDNLIGQLNQFEYVVADSLPTASASTMYKIYLIPSTVSQTQNAKEEYITIRSGAGTEQDPYTYAWEHIGSTNIDLSSYCFADANIPDTEIVIGDGGTRKVKGSGITISSGTLASSSTTVPTSSAVYTAVSGKQDTLTAGNGITITNNTVASIITTTDVVLDF